MHKLLTPKALCRIPGKAVPDYSSNPRRKVIIARNRVVVVWLADVPDELRFERRVAVRSFHMTPWGNTSGTVENSHAQGPHV